ncbi:MAG: flagellar biosynthesis protein FlhB [Alphaproteobacteria bacterium]|nr:flagellar biosynthesis protein FlhB [Alphaproteobacteria bacterium]
MAEQNEDQSQKTEDPTQHRLNEAKKKGQVPNSREVNNFFVMLSLALMIAWLFPPMFEKARMALAPFIVNPHDIIITPESLREVMGNLLLKVGVMLIAPLSLILLLVIGAALMQSQLVFAVERIKPKLEKISIIKGLKRLFSLRSVVEFLKGIVKISIISFVALMAVYSDLPTMEMLPTYELNDMMTYLSGLAFKIMVGVCCVMFVVAAADFAYQRFEFMKSMRMSKQEIKDEHKQQEGDPQIKSKLRQIRMERARQRMMASVPNADVVITNPTHYAVALSYETGLMQAPILLAKGVDEVAFRIRDVAKEHDIPIVENPPLARALHASVELDQEIPYEHYKAVAEVISYVYRLKGKMS